MSQGFVTVYPKCSSQWTPRYETKQLKNKINLTHDKYFIVFALQVYHVQKCSCLL